MKRILLVDDNQDLIRTLSRQLDSEKLDITAVSTVEEARSRLETEAFDFLITDLRLTDSKQKEGLELISFADRINPNIRSILITGNGDGQILNEAFERGACFFLDKPVDIQLLKRILIPSSEVAN